MSNNTQNQQQVFDMHICEELSFASSEAYKLLRTSVQYGFSENHGCKVIGVTSSIRNEGKSSLSINLAYMLSKDKNKVLLLEADMRLPNIARRLEINPTPGLSDYLTGAAKNNDGIQRSEKAPNLSIITAGIIPPNPSELLGSLTMQKLISALREIYDYIIVDLPPVNIVSDPLVVSKLIDGYIFVVRSGYSVKKEVLEAKRKLDIVGANILGFALNSNLSSEKKYGKYYSNYYSKPNIKENQSK